MSVAAVSWALKTDVGRPSSKLVLLVLANAVRYEATEWTAYASVDDLIAATHLDRKTVLDATRRLTELGVLEDTGLRAGATRRITVWRIKSKVDNPAVGHAAAPATAATLPETAEPARVAARPSRAGPRETTGSLGSRLPAQWTLPDDWRTWARGVSPGWSASRIDAMAATFHAYWRSKPGMDSYSADWFASWRLWVLRETTHAAARPPAGSSRDRANPAQDAFLLAQARAAGIEATPGESTVAFLARVQVELGRRAARVDPDRRSKPIEPRAADDG